MNAYSKHGIKAGLGLAILAGMVQAAPVTMTAINTYTGNTSWQDVKSVSYNLNDLNGNNLVDVGEQVTFSVTMHKQWWGTHDWDALKVWVDGSPLNPPTSTVYSSTAIWDYDPLDIHYAPGQWTEYSNKTWTGGDRSFNFNYTFLTAGDFFFTASVMCSADLSDLVGSYDDKPTSSDWAAWTQNIHQINPNLQGETERYKIRVNPPAVPEPGTLGLMGLGLIGLAGLAHKRRKA